MFIDFIVIRPLSTSSTVYVGIYVMIKVMCRSVWLHVYNYRSVIKYVCMYIHGQLYNYVCMHVRVAKYRIHRPTDGEIFKYVCNT